IDALAVDLEPRVPARDDVELLVGRLLALLLLVLVDDPVAGVVRRPGRDTERADAEVVPHRLHRAASVLQHRNLVDVRDRVSAHLEEPPPSRCRLAARVYGGT